MTSVLHPGLASESTHTVTREMTAEAVGVADIEALATPSMIGLMELASWQAVQPALEVGMTSVGSFLEIRHLAPTPIGDVVRVRSELIEVDGRRLVFRVEAWDSVGQVGEGTHGRIIVSQVRFMERVSRRGQPD